MFPIGKKKKKKRKKKVVSIVTIEDKVWYQVRSLECDHLNNIHCESEILVWVSTSIIHDVKV